MKMFISISVKSFVCCHSAEYLQFVDSFSCEKHSRRVSTYLFVSSSSEQQKYASSTLICDSY